MNQQESLHESDQDPALSDRSRGETKNGAKLRLNLDNRRYGSLAGGFDLGGSIQGLEKILAQYDREQTAKEEDISEEGTPDGEENSDEDEDKRYCGCINSSTLVFKAFYFFYFFAIGSLYPYLAVFYKQLWLSSKETGVLIGIRPLIQLIGAPMWGIIADTYKATKIIFILSLTAWLVSNYSLSLVPPGVHSYPCRDNGTLTSLSVLLSNNGNNSEVLRFLKPILHVLRKMPVNQRPTNSSSDRQETSEAKNTTNKITSEPDTNVTKQSPETHSMNSNDSMILTKTINKKLKKLIKSLTIVRRELQQQKRSHRNEEDLGDAFYSDNGVISEESESVREDILSNFFAHVVGHSFQDDDVATKEAVSDVAYGEHSLKVRRGVLSSFNASVQLTPEELKVLYRSDFSERLFDFLNMEGQYPWSLSAMSNDPTLVSDSWTSHREKHLFSILLAITVIGTLIAAPAATLADTATLQAIGESREWKLDLQKEGFLSPCRLRRSPPLPCARTNTQTAC